MPISVAARESLIESFRNKIAWFLAFACRPPFPFLPFSTIICYCFFKLAGFIIEALERVAED